MTLRLVARNERVLTLYARPGAVTSAVRLGEWWEAVVAPPQVCESSIAMIDPVRDGCAAVLPAAGLSAIARTHASGETTEAMPSAQPNAESAPSLMPSPTMPRTWSACLPAFNGFAFQDCRNCASCALIASKFPATPQNLLFASYAPGIALRFSIAARLIV